MVFTSSVSGSAVAGWSSPSCLLRLRLFCAAFDADRAKPGKGSTVRMVGMSPVLLSSCRSDSKSISPPESVWSEGRSSSDLVTLSRGLSVTVDRKKSSKVSSPSRLSDSRCWLMSTVFRKSNSCSEANRSGGRGPSRMCSLKNWSVSGSAGSGNTGADSWGVVVTSGLGWGSGPSEHCSPEDYSALQADIDCIHDGTRACYLTVNPLKCKYLVCSRERQPHLPPAGLFLANTVLEKVESYRYLGVLVTSKLSWSDHIDQICTKARKLIGMLYRQLYSWADTNTLLLIYTTCIHPHLEYSCQLWDPFTSKGRQSLEAVQKCACKVCLKMWDLDYNTM